MNAHGSSRYQQKNEKWNAALSSVYSVALFIYFYFFYCFIFLFIFITFILYEKLCIIEIKFKNELSFILLISASNREIHVDSVLYIVFVVRVERVKLV